MSFFQDIYLHIFSVTFEIIILIAVVLLPSSLVHVLVFEFMTFSPPRGIEK